ncbi:Hypothetical protein PHPALM_9901 [Phytophthora palmivora]|uniref:Uncharacterized protein n=1 Tax=Phytophthora palmivora TaxID=4796 RepID=A0A2P4Y638_9STRA|nr:Hypothetical protein PHPALM_9901 [Phytophthora palmivora]
MEDIPESGTVADEVVVQLRTGVDTLVVRAARRTADTADSEVAGRVMDTGIDGSKLGDAVQVYRTAGSKAVDRVMHTVGIVDSALVAVAQAVDRSGYTADSEIVVQATDIAGTVGLELAAVVRRIVD